MHTPPKQSNRVRKMLLATGNTVHADEMDRSLYNNILCGISQDGTHYFYSQPLRYDPLHHKDADGKAGGHRGYSRHPFLSCSCCPPNLHRLFAAIGDYNSTMWILHLALGDELELINDLGQPVRLRLVATLKTSVFQSELLISEDDFLERYSRTNRFRWGHPTGFRSTPDGSALLFLRSGPRSPVRDLYLLDLATGEERRFLSAEQLLAGQTEDLSDEEKARRERTRAFLSKVL